MQDPIDTGHILLLTIAKRRGTIIQAHVRHVRPAARPTNTTE
jgi:hypothetical protein